MKKRNNDLADVARKMMDGVVQIQIGIASCRERVEIRVVAEYIKKKQIKHVKEQEQ